MGFTEEQLRELAASSFPAAIGVEFETLAPDRVTGRVQWRADLTGDGRILHGGVLMSFADTLGAYGTALALEEGQTTATLESKTNFFRAAGEGVVEGEAVLLHRGRHAMCWQTTLRQGGKLISQTTQTQILVRVG
jgi:1,4-dihydroxy-2-naphthoyl-CoA hydrolase